MDKNVIKNKFEKIETWSNKISKWLTSFAKNVNDLEIENKTHQKKIQHLERDLRKLKQDTINTSKQYNQALKKIKQLENDNRNMKQDLDHNSKTLHNIVKALK